MASGVKKTVKFKAPDRCTTCEGTGAKPGTKPAPCTTCGGSGEVRRAARSMFGQFVSVAPCPTCAGEGVVVREPCEVCRGEGRVRGERTVDGRDPRRRLHQQLPDAPRPGRRGPAQRSRGDLLVMLDIKEDDRFERQGDDLIFDLPLSFSQAALGVRVTRCRRPTATRASGSLPGTQPETVAPAPGARTPGSGSERQGRPDRPGTRLDAGAAHAEQERLFRELAKLEGEPPKRSPGFWSKLKEALGA